MNRWGYPLLGPPDIAANRPDRACLEVEELLQPLDPLLEQRLAVNEHERRASLAAIRAVAITVLPMPGGAHSTPKSWPSIAGTASS